MGDLPSIQLLEATHHFPGPYVFKVIGRTAVTGFIAQVVAAVREETATELDPPYTVRSSTGGRHVSVTLEPIMQTGAQVLAVYRRIRQLPGLTLLF